MNALIRLFVDPLRPTVGEVPHAFRLEVDPRAWIVPGTAGIALLVVGLVLGLAVGEGYGLFSTRFYFAYLTGFSFILTIALGALFFVLIQHISRSMWSSTVRRLAEFLMMGFPLLAVLALPIVFGMHDLYHWTHAELYEVGGPDYDPILAGKASYLNTPFFLVRLVLYFGVWIFLSQRLYRLSVLQDVAPRAETAAQLRKVGAYGIPLFAVTTAFAGFDLLMSLDPHWFSTIFGVYFFSGAFFVFLATLVLFAKFVQRTGKLGNEITQEHYHDLGKFMFAFAVFWSYIAFSQYMLIWYGNLPEETLWFRHRFEGSWGLITALLIYGHFFLPFFGLITRVAKRIRPWMTFMAIWFLFIHFVDLYWVILPNLDLVTGGHGHGFSLDLLDVVLFLGLLGVFFAFTLFRATRHSLVAFNDARFKTALTFENA